jgi:hypothetical protein
LRHLPGLPAVGTCSAIKDILTIMSNEQAIAAAAWDPIINGALLETGTHNFARNSADLEALNLLHDALIIPCQRRKHQ